MRIADLRCADGRSMGGLRVDRICSESFESTVFIPVRMSTTPTLLRRSVAW